MSRKSKRNKLFFLLSISLAILFLLGYGGYQLFKYKAQEITSEEIIQKLNKLVELPKDENPTIMSVTNPEKLSEQKFFAEAEIGDKVIIFSKSRKAILYRPKEDKIISIAPIK